MPRYAKKLDTTEMKAGQDTVVNMPVTGKPRLERDSDIEVVEGPLDTSHADQLAFMEETVTIMILPSTDKNAEQWIPLINDGRPHWVRRGVRTEVKRKYVEVLLNAKQTSYRNEEGRDMDGNLTVRYPSSTALKYPFQVLEDLNPKGQAWLEWKMAQP